MTHCYFHPHAPLERIAQDIRFTSIDGDRLEHRVMLRCSAMLSEPHGSVPGLRCPFVCAEYDEDRVDERKCYKCGAALTSTDDSALSLKRCLGCISRHNKKYRIDKKAARMRNAKKSGRALLEAGRAETA